MEIDVVRINNKKYFLALLAVMLMYSMYWYSVILYFFPGLMTLKQFAIVLAAVTVLYIIVQVIKDRFIIEIPFILCALGIGLLIFLYGYVTPYLYGYIEVSDSFYAEFLAFAGQTFPTALIAYIVGKDNSVQKDIKSLAFAFGLIFSVIAFLCTINPSGVSNVGLAETANNLNYQTLSYMAAYGTSFLLYYFLADEDIDYLKKGSKVMKFCCMGVIVINLFTVLLAGGRGGMLDYIALLLVSFWLFQKKPANGMDKAIKSFLIILAVFISFIVIIFLVARSNIASSGFGRIVGFFNGNGDSVRSSLYRGAFESFFRSPIIGHGIGASFYEVGFYTHNFITDLLVETGLTGTVIAIVLIFKALRYELNIIKDDFSNSLWLLLLVNAMVHYSFSGYYLAAFEPVWLIFMLLTKKSRDLLYS